MRGEGKRAEQIGKGRVAHIQSAGELAKGRHHHARCVGGKAAPAHGTAALRDARDRMQMAADFAGGAGRQMAEGQCAEHERLAERAADAVGRFGIVVSRDPYPVAAALHRHDIVAILVAEPRRPAAIMETVAERDDHARRIARDQLCEARQGGGGVVRRQQHPARGKARAFFQMQIADREQALFRPIERAFGIGDEGDGGDGDNVVRSLSHPSRCYRNCRHFIASFTSSSAASASSVSDASP